MHDHHFHHQEIPVSVLLSHMVEHNESHRAELLDLAEKMSGEAKEKVLCAAESIKQGNEKLSEALKLLREEM